MLDLIADAIGLLVEGGVDSPDRLSRQRLGRLIAALVSGAFAIAVQVLAPPGVAWTLLVSAAAVAAAWAAAFSLVDLAKERSAAWLSGLVVLLGGGAAAGAGWVAVTRIVAA